MIEIKITREIKTKRLDKFLISYFNNTSKNFIYKLIRKKIIKVNNKKCDFKINLKEGDAIQIYLSDSTLEKIKGNNKELDRNYGKNIFLSIAYEDKNILIVNKPRGVIVHSDNSEKFWILQNFVIQYLIEIGEYNPKIHNFMPSPVHRIDRNTEGLVIFAKTFESHKFLSYLFKSKLIKKYYLTIAHGNIKKRKTVTLNLLKDEHNNRVIISQSGKKATTIINPLMQNNKYTLLEAQILTGVTHQIRKSLLEIGNPIIGDIKYGNKEINKFFKEKYKLSNHLLAAYKIVFPSIEESSFKYLSEKTFYYHLSPLFIKISNDLFKNKFKIESLYKN